MNGKQLKNSILQWAIQGKLVPQDPNDEPASVLLERIRAEKKRLIKEGKIKKDKNESIIFRGEDNSHYEKFADGTVKCIDDEIPFEVPQSWEWIRLGSIIDFSKSGSIKSQFISDSAWILDLEDIEKDAGRLLQKKRMKDIKSKSDKHPFSKGNVLYSKLRPYLNKVIIADEDGYCTTEILSFDFGHIYNRYAQTYLMSPYFVEYAMSDAYGVKMPRLGSKQGNTALMPVPPKEEQKKIVEVIDSITLYISRYRDSQNTLNNLNKGIRPRLKKSILQEAIQGRLVPQDPDDEPVSVLVDRIRKDKQKLLKEGKLKSKDLVESVIFKGEDNKYYEKVGGKTLDISDEIPFDIPVSWEWIRMGALFSHNTGKALNRADTVGIKKKYLTTSNVYWNRFDFREVREMYFSESELEKCTVQKGDLLVCEGGDVGRTAIWKYDEDICIQNHIHRLRAFYPINTEFYYLVLYHYKNIGNIGGKGIGIQGLSSGALHRLIVPLPPINEQYRITAQYNTVIASTMRKKVIRY